MSPFYARHANNEWQLCTTITAEHSQYHTSACKMTTNQRAGLSIACLVQISPNKLTDPFSSEASLPYALRGGVASKNMVKWRIEGDTLTTEQIAGRLKLSLHKTRKIFTFAKRQEGPVTWDRLRHINDNWRNDSYVGDMFK